MARRTAALILVLVLLASGMVAYLRYCAPAVDHAVRLVPADAAVYVHTFLRPSTDQRRALRDLLERFPQTDSDEEAEDFAVALIERVAQAFGVEIAGVPDWLGDEAATFAIGDGDGLKWAALLAVDDEDAALEALGDPGSGRSVGIVDGFVVIGDDYAYRAAVDAEPDSSLAADEIYGEHLERLPEQRMASFYGTRGTLLGLLPPELLTLLWPNPTLALDARIAGSVALRHDSAVVDAVQRSNDCLVLCMAETDSGTRLPAGSGVAMEVPRFAERWELIEPLLPPAITTTIEQMESSGDGARIEKWAETFRFFVRITLRGPEGGVYLGGGNQAKIDDFFQGARSYASASLPPFAGDAIAIEEKTFSFQAGGVPVHFVRVGDGIVVATSEEALTEALIPRRSLAEESVGREAVEDGYTLQGAAAPQLFSTVIAPFAGQRGVEAAREMSTVSLAGRQSDGFQHERLTIRF